MSNPNQPPAANSTSTILVVDDNAGILEFLLLLLSKNGLNCVGASSGQEALEIVSQRNIDLIILDVMMPVMDGLQVCREIKKHHPSIPIILLTAKDDMGTRAAGMKLGVSEFVAKPVNNRDLLTRIRTQLSTLEQGRAAEQIFAQIDSTHPRLGK
jgi:DNA-binding response OmpR family regulator